MATTSKVKKRNSNIEILRFVLMVYIFLWHLLVHGCDFEFIGHIEYKYNIYISIIAAVILVPCVNCFMFISGWFGMKFRAAKLMNLSFICIISGLICLPINRYIGFGGGHISLGTLYVTIFPISTRVWWFMTSYMMVYLVSPFIEKGMRVINKTEFLYIIIGMSLIEVLCIPQKLNWGSSFFGLLYIYILGRFMNLNGIDLKLKQGLFLYLGMTFIMIAGLELINLTPIKKGALFWSLQFNNPLIVLQAIGLFFGVKSIKPNYNKFINKVFQPCLCIYLITEKILPYKYVVNLFNDNIIKGITATCVIVIGSLLIGQLIYLVANKTTFLCQYSFNLLKENKKIKLLLL